MVSTLFYVLAAQPRFLSSVQLGAVHKVRHAILDQF